ncbi:MAG: DUF4157 domain-containing protein [Anaerolineae bacterium]|nr:DUF4157 domain-containing protein [Anaerolineae bacterium]
MSGELDHAKPIQGQEAKRQPQAGDFQAAPGEAEAGEVQAAFLAGGASAPNPPPASDKESPYAHPTAQSLRQSAILQMQQTVGNHYVARMLARSEATSHPEAPETRAKAKDDPVVVQSQLGRGQPLDTQVKSTMEEAFGQDFSQVQTHTDAPAARLSTGLNARAFAVGNHVAFADGEYQPGTPTGDALIAHELAHVTQQQGATGHQAGVMKKGEGESSAAEADADRSAIGVVASIWGKAKGAVSSLGQSAVPSLKTGLGLQRCTRRAAPPPITAQRVEFSGSHAMSPAGTDTKANPVWTPGASDHAAAYTKGANPVVNATFNVGSLPGGGDAGADAGPATVAVRVKEGGAVRATRAGITPASGAVTVAGLPLVGLTGSTGVRASNYNLDWELSTDGGTTWATMVTTGSHLLYWLYAPPLAAPLRNVSVARATTYAGGAVAGPAVAAAIRSGLRGSVNYSPSDPINGDPLTVFDDGVGICTDFANLLTLLARSVGMNANTVLYWGGFQSLGENIRVTLAGGLASLNNVKSPNPAYNPPGRTGWDFTYHAISRIEGVLQDAALDRTGYDAQAVHDGKIVHLVELAGGAPPAGTVGTPYNYDIPRQDHTIAVTVRDYGPYLSGAEIGNYAGLGVPVGASSPIEVPVLWTTGVAALPAGLTLNPATGALTGTPTAAGTFAITVSVQAPGTSLVTTVPFTLTIAPAPRRRPRAKSAP